MQSPFSTPSLTKLTAKLQLLMDNEIAITKTFKRKSENWQHSDVH